MLEKEAEPIIVPKIMHFIWAGGFGRLPENNMLTIAKWASQNPEIKIILWVDEKTSGSTLELLNKQYQQNFDAAYRKITESKEQSIPNLLEVRDIRASGICGQVDEIVDYELDRIDPNYGASSDILRSRILKLKGGVYTDSDVGPSTTPLRALPEFISCSAHVVYLNDLSQVKNDDIVKISPAPFLINFDRIGNDAFISSSGDNPFFNQLVHHIEQENYQLAPRWREQKDSSLFTAILVRTYASRTNIKGITIDCTGPGTVRHVLENNKYGKLVHNENLESIECHKIFGKEEVLIKPMKRGSYQLVEPEVVIKPATGYKAPNQGAWLNVTLDTVRFDTVEKIFENVNKTIMFEQKHFGILRLEDHFRLLRRVAIELDEDPKKICPKFIEQLELRNIINNEALICVQHISLDPQIYSFYEKHKLLEKSNLLDTHNCRLIYECITSYDFFHTKSFSDNIINNERLNKIWCQMIFEIFGHNEVENIFVKFEIGTHFIEMLLNSPGIYCNKYPIDDLNNTLIRYQILLEKSIPLSKICKGMSVNVKELMETINGLKIKIGEIKKCYIEIDTNIRDGISFFKKNDFEKALVVFQKNLVAAVKIVGRYDPKIASLNYNIASCLIRLERENEAIPYLQNCVQIRSKLFGENDIQTVKAIEKLKELELKISKKNDI